MVMVISIHDHRSSYQTQKQPDNGRFIIIMSMVAISISISIMSHSRYGSHCK